MANPFEKRATEYLRDDEAFLDIVTPEPLATFFMEHAKSERLYDRLVIVIGTPGSGKTTLARLFQFTTLHTLLRNPNMSNYSPLVDALTACEAIDDDSPNFVGGRLPLEAEYRDFWEFSYPDEIKTGLMIGLLQARMVLDWIRSIEASGVPIDQVEIVPRVGAEAALTAIGGKAGRGVRDRARAVEHAIYNISAALMPPRIENIDRDAISAYQPFDVIEAFRVPYGGSILQLRPLAIFDDAHRLHPEQFREVRRWITRREIKVSRWILTRLDALNPDEVLLDTEVKPSREITAIRMQDDGSRSSRGREFRRREFRKMAKDMAGRYLSQMGVFNRRRLHNFSSLLSTVEPSLSASKTRQIGKRIDILQLRYGISANHRENLEKKVNNYLASSGKNSDDLRLQILSILFERYAKRRYPSMLDDDSDSVQLTRPLTVKAGVADGARIHLLHDHKRPYFFGIDALCDASNENAEQFLQLASRLVSQSETQLVRRKGAIIESKRQHDLLQERAAEMVKEWNFPQCDAVRRLADGMAQRCLEKSLEKNASLGGGATAFGIPQEEYCTIPRKHSDLARVLQFGVAYNAFVLVPNHRTKNRLWCLIELGGVLLLRHGLTLRRGGFLPRRVGDLTRLLRGR